MDFELPESHVRASDRAREVGLTAVAPTAAIRDRINQLIRVATPGTRDDRPVAAMERLTQPSA